MLCSTEQNSAVIGSSHANLSIILIECVRGSVHPCLSVCMCVNMSVNLCTCLCICVCVHVHLN